MTASGESGRGTPSPWESIFWWVSFAWLLRSLDVLLYGSWRDFSVAQIPGLGSTAGLFLIAAIYATTLILLFRERDRSREVLAVAWPWLPVVALAVLSAAWSEDAMRTLQRAGALVATSAWGVLLGLRLDLARQVRLLGFLTGAIVLACIAASTLFPAHATMTDVDGGAWNGIFTNRFTLGSRMVFAVALFTPIALGMRRGRVLGWVGVFLSLVAVVGSQSRSAWIVFPVLLGIGVLCSVAQRIEGRAQIRLLGTSVVLGLAFVVLGLLWADPLLAALGKDATLNARAPLWGASIEVARVQPWLGYGFEAVWSTVADRPDQPLHDFQWAAHAHNGFLDLVLGLGVVGLLAWLIPFGILVQRVFRWGIAGPSALALWPFLFFCFLGLSNLTNSALLVGNRLEWGLYVALSTGFLREIRRGG